MQVPRNDFKLLLNGANLVLTDKISLVPNAETCADNGNDALDATHTSSKTLTSSSFVSHPNVTGTHAVSFEWFTYDCKPTLNGVLGHTMPDDKCPTVGWYRLCYVQGSNTPEETGISVYFEQATIHVVTNPFTDGFVHAVNTPWDIVVHLRDGNGQPCCMGTKVHLSLTKDGADHSEYLYNGGNSNQPDDKIAFADQNGVATFASYTIQRTAGINYYLTASVAGHSVNMPPLVDNAQGVFQVRPTRLTIVTAFASEYTVGASLTATLPAAVTIRAEDNYGTLLTGLVTSDDYHCEVQLQTGDEGTDSRYSGRFNGINTQMTSEDLSPLDVQFEGANRPVFNAGIAVVNDLKILNQAGWYAFHCSLFCIE